MAEIYTLPKSAAQKASVQRMATAAVHYLKASERRAEAALEAAKTLTRLRTEAEDSLVKFLAQITNSATGKAEAQAITQNALARIYGCLND